MSSVGTVATPTSAPPRADSVGRAGLPSDRHPTMINVSGMLYRMTGKHPADNAEKSFGGVIGIGSTTKTYKQVWDAAVQDGKITRDELEQILKFYGIDKVTDEFWAAFAGSGTDGTVRDSLTLSDLEKRISLLQRIDHLTAIGLKYMCESTDITIVPTKEFTKTIQGRGASYWENSTNPVVRDAWQNAKARSGLRPGDAPTQDTWDWFALDMMTKFTKDLKESGIDVSDLNMKHGLTRQLFDKRVEEWMTNNQTITKNQWSDLIKQGKLIEKLETAYGIKVGDIRLNSPQDVADLNQALKLYDDDKTKNKTQVMQILGRLRNSRVAMPGQLMPGALPPPQAGALPPPITPAVNPNPAGPVPVVRGSVSYPVNRTATPSHGGRDY